jgi:hypothetical protein
MSVENTTKAVMDDGNQLGKLFDGHVSSNERYIGLPFDGPVPLLEDKSATHIIAHTGKPRHPNNSLTRSLWFMNASHFFVPLAPLKTKLITLQKLLLSQPFMNTVPTSWVCVSLPLIMSPWYVNSNVVLPVLLTNPFFLLFQ